MIELRIGNGNLIRLGVAARPPGPLGSRMPAIIVDVVAARFAKSQHQLFVHQLVHRRLKEVTATTIGRWNQILLLALAPSVRDRR